MAALLIIAAIIYYQQGPIDYYYDHYLYFPSHENQDYEYLFNCSGASSFASETTLLDNEPTINDSSFGRGFFSIQLNVMTLNESSPGPELQAIVIGNITNGFAYFRLYLQEWQYGSQLLFDRHSLPSPYIAVEQDDRLLVQLAQNETGHYTTDFSVERSSGPAFWTSQVEVPVSHPLKMVEAETGVYGLGNASRSTFGPPATPLFDQRLSTSVDAASSTVGGNCGEGLFVTRETSNLRIQNVTSSQDSVAYTLVPS